MSSGLPPLGLPYSHQDASALRLCAREGGVRRELSSPAGSAKAPNGRSVHL